MSEVSSRKIISLLKNKLESADVEVLDESDQHAGHAGSGHYAVFLSSPLFKGHSLIEKHRMVYDALEEMKDEIHALRIKILE